MIGYLNLFVISYLLVLVNVEKLLKDINNRLIINTITWKKRIFLPVDFTVYDSVYGVHNFI